MKRKNKKGVSLMVAYALLIVMAIGLSVGVYMWLKNYIPNLDKDECPEGVSLVILEYNCLSGDRIELTIKNEGLFNIEGYYIRGSNKTDKVAEVSLPIAGGGLPGGAPGIYSFVPPLEPKENNEASFSYASLTELKKIEIEPFRIQEKKGGVKKEIIVLCKDASIVQEIAGCD